MKIFRLEGSEGKVGGFGDIIVEFWLANIVGNVEDGKVVAGVLIVNENEVTCAMLD